MSHQSVLLVVGLMFVTWGCSPAGRPVGSPQVPSTPARPFHLSVLEDADFSQSKSSEDGLLSDLINRGQEVWDFLTKSKLHADLKISIQSQDGKLDAEAVQGTDSKRSSGQCKWIKKDGIEFLVVKVLDHRRDAATESQEERQSYRQIVMEIPLVEDAGLRPSIVSYRQIGFSAGSMVRPHNRSDVNQASLQVRSSEDGSSRVHAIVTMAAYDANTELHIDGNFSCPAKGSNLFSAEEQP